MSFATSYGGPSSSSSSSSSSSTTTPATITNSGGERGAPAMGTQPDDFQARVRRNSFHTTGVHLSLPFRNSSSPVPASFSASQQTQSLPESTAQNSQTTTTSSALLLPVGESMLLERLSKLVQDKADLFDKNFKYQQELFDAHAELKAHRARIAKNGHHIEKKFSEKSKMELAQDLDDLLSERNTLKEMFDDLIVSFQEVSTERDDLYVRNIRLEEYLLSKQESEMELNALKEALDNEREKRISAEKELEVLRNDEHLVVRVQELQDQLEEEQSIRESLEDLMNEEGTICPNCLEILPSKHTSHQDKKTGYPSSATIIRELESTNQRLEIENSKLRQELCAVSDKFAKNNRRLQKEIDYAHAIEDEYEDLEEKLEEQYLHIKELKKEIHDLRDRLGMNHHEMADSSQDDSSFSNS